MVLLSSLIRQMLKVGGGGGGEGGGRGKVPILSEL